MQYVVYNQTLNMYLVDLDFKYTQPEHNQTWSPGHKKARKFWSKDAAQIIASHVKGEVHTYQGG